MEDRAKLLNEPYSVDGVQQFDDTDPILLADAQQAWRVYNIRFKRWLLEGCSNHSPEKPDFVLPDEFAHFVKALKAQFPTSTGQWIDELHNFRRMPGESVAGLMTRLRRLHDLTNCLTPEQLATKAEACLPEEIKPTVVNAIFHYNKDRRKREQPLMTLAEIQEEAEAIELEYRQRQSQARLMAHGIQVSPDGEGRGVRSLNRSAGLAHIGEENSQRREGFNRRVCNKCKRPGHVASDCRQREQRTCHACGRPGHLSKDCRSKDRASQFPPKPVHTGMAFYPDQTSGAKCEHCGRLNHTKDQCWRLHPERRPQKHQHGKSARDHRAQVRAQLAEPVDNNDLEPVDDYVPIVYTLIQDESNGDDWEPDSFSEEAYNHIPDVCVVTEQEHTSQAGVGPHGDGQTSQPKFAEGRRSTPIEKDSPTGMPRPKQPFDHPSHFLAGVRQYAFIQLAQEGGRYPHISTTIP